VRWRQAARSDHAATRKGFHTVATTATTLKFLSSLATPPPRFLGAVQVPGPRASDPTCRSDRFRSDPCRISSESGIFHKNRSDPTWFLSDSFRSESGPDFIGIQRNARKSDQIRPEFHRVSLNSGPDSDRKEFDKNCVGSDRNIQIRQDPIPPL